MNELSLISYIKNSYETLVQVLVEEKINKYNQKKDNYPQEYEALLIKLEKDIRTHIQTEHQLKLYAESLQTVIEEKEKENIILKKMLSNIDNNDNHDNNNNNNINVININDKINELKQEIEINKKILKSYESQNLKLTESEKNLKAKLINEYKIFNKKEIKYKQKIDSLNEKILEYEKKINKLIKDDNLVNNQYSSNNKKSIDRNEKENNNKNKLHKSIIKNFNKMIYSNTILYDNKKMVKTYRTNKNDNNNKHHHNGPALSASSSNEKIESYLINKFAKTQLHFKSKMNIKNSGSKKIQSPYNNSMVEKVIHYDNYYSNNKLQMNDSQLNNIPLKQKKKYNRQKSAENNSKLMLNKNINDNLLKSIIMSNNNSVFNINVKRGSIKNSKGKNNMKYTKVPSSTCSLKGKIKKKVNNNNGTINNNNGKIINNNINIYAHTLRQDNHNVYIRENNEKSLYNSLRGSSGNSSARDYYHINRYNYELINFRKHSFKEKKMKNQK